MNIDLFKQMLAQVEDEEAWKAFAELLKKQPALRLYTRRGDLLVTSWQTGTGGVTYQVGSGPASQAHYARWHNLKKSIYVKNTTATG